MAQGAERTREYQREGAKLHGVEVAAYTIGNLERGTSRWSRRRAGSGEA